MKNKKLILDQEEEDSVNIGLLRLAKDIPDYEFFFAVNQINLYQFSRIEDLVIDAKFFIYRFSRFEAFHHETKTCIQFIANKSKRGMLKNHPSELFIDEDEIKYLINYHQEVDYIIKTSDIYHDFSLILLPEVLAFAIQDFAVTPNHEELYQIIQYYE